ncbi:4'-phosphopantetheinyl transferase superfamily protein [Kitasatospora sp. NBC_01560]|uniref:holo-ACP synthase n=1 Tax=Kitasatospora sp. NBC_01560 TaxID=2975965 RepID=UPI003870A19F
MAGPGRQLTGLGHDLQLVAEVAGVRALREPGVFFTAGELQRIAAAASPDERLAGAFAAKEALFKALPPGGRTWFWTDAELVHDRHGAPSFRTGGALARRLAGRGLRLKVSISHSGGFASAVVFATWRAGGGPVPRTTGRTVRHAPR